jgi:hypothetical protein
VDFELKAMRFQRMAQISTVFLNGICGFILAAK